MDHILSNDDDVFEAESPATTRRMRRVAAPQADQPTLRSFGLILARCESAATLLGWRKQITPDQKRCLDAAVLLLQEAAARIAVCGSASPAAPKRDKNVPHYPMINI